MWCSRILQLHNILKTSHRAGLVYCHDLLYTLWLQGTIVTRTMISVPEMGTYPLSKAAISSSIVSTVRPLPHPAKPLTMSFTASGAWKACLCPIMLKQRTVSRIELLAPFHFIV